MERTNTKRGSEKGSKSTVVLLIRRLVLSSKRPGTVNDKHWVLLFQRIPVCVTERMQAAGWWRGVESGNNGVWLNDVFDLWNANVKIFSDSEWLFSAPAARHCLNGQQQGTGLPSRLTATSDPTNNLYHALQASVIRPTLITSSRS